MGAAAIPAGLGLVGSLIGGSQQSSEESQANQAAQQDAQEQANLQQQGLDLSNYLKNIYQQDYAGLNPQLGGIYGAELSATGSQIPKTDQEALQYLSNPGATVSGINGVGGQALKYDLNEAQNGLNPQYAQNALSQAAAGDQQSINNAMNTMGSEANPNSQITNAQNQYLAQRTNLAGQFAGDSQQLSNQAMQAAQQTAQGIDAQTMSMLTGGANLGQSLTSNVQGAVGQQQGFIPDISNQLLQTGAQYGAAGAESAYNAQQIQQNSVNPFTAAASAFANAGTGSPAPGAVTGNPTYGGTYDPNGGVDGTYQG